MNRTKRLIFDSAIRIFSDCGYRGATMDDIASNAGLAQGTLYYHFTSKEESSSRSAKRRNWSYRKTSKNK